MFSVTDNVFRSTSDIDLVVQKNFDRANDILIQTINANENEYVTFKLINTNTSMNERVYSGTTYKIEGNLDNLRIPFKIDVGYEKNYKTSIIPIPSLISDEDELEFEAYTLETTVSEKIHALLAYKIDTTRLKDLYDIYSKSNWFGL
ncbi:nucleotidyl transferase AbiEii/AbiGii toxin family protein [Mycoplasmatota bacterium WC44]